MVIDPFRKGMGIQYIYIHIYNIHIIYTIYISYIQYNIYMPPSYDFNISQNIFDLKLYISFREEQAPYPTLP